MLRSPALLAAMALLGCSPVKLEPPAPLARQSSALLAADAAAIGHQYDCALPSKADFVLGNIGYSFPGDEQAWSLARLLAEKGCTFPNKVAVFYVATVNFPLDGIAAGTGATAERAWLDYWALQVSRYTSLGYQIWLHPSPFILNPTPTDNLFDQAGLRALTEADLDLTPAARPAVFECRDGRSTRLASIYDPNTLPLGMRFYQGLKTFFSASPAFAKLSVVTPSDFGEFGFPFGVPASWWAGSADVSNCYLTGDVAARSLIASDPPAKALYDDRLTAFHAALTTQVRAAFPGKRLAMYLGFGNDTNPRDGFSYAAAAQTAIANNIELHSSHGLGLTVAQVPLDKIVIGGGKPAGYPFTLEDAGDLNEYKALKNLFLSARYGMTGMLPYALYDHLWLTQLDYAMRSPPVGSLVASKGITFDDAAGLGALRSAELVDGFMDAPQNAGTVSGDATSPIGGWGYYRAPYGDHQNYGVDIYAGPLVPINDATCSFPTGAPGDCSCDGTCASHRYHPRFMRRVAQAVTMYERATGNGDLSRFGAAWKPDLATGPVVVRVYLVNGGSEIIAEHPSSPMIVNIAGKVSGSASFTRVQAVTAETCRRELRAFGRVTSTTLPGAALNVVILDEYRGLVLAQTTTDAIGDFDVTFTVPGGGAEATRAVTPRAYAWVDNDADGSPNLVALPGTLTPVLGYATQDNIFDVYSDCRWRDGVVCDDGNACTYGDQWANQICTGTSVTCADDPGTCGARRACNGTTNCTVSYAAATVGCDDGNACTASDTCDGAGHCIGATVACPAGACMAATCDPAAGCALTPITECVSGDGCCPAGCEPGVDQDCLADGGAESDGGSKGDGGSVSDAGSSADAVGSCGCSGFSGGPQVLVVLAVALMRRRKWHGEDRL
ncbi:MAG: hypothetical protein ACYC8T_17925 [Myxococcaceae bacterium]